MDLYAGAGIGLLASPRPGIAWAVPTVTVGRRQRDAFEAFFLANYDSVARSVAFVCGDAERAADATQEAFIRAYAKWRRVRAYDYPATWVRRVAINITRDHHRSDRRRSAREQSQFELTPPVESEIAATLQDSPILAALARLPDQQRSVAALYYLDDLSVADVAELLEIAEGTARFHLSKARERLRVELDSASDRDMQREVARHVR